MRRRGWSAMRMAVAVLVALGAGVASAGEPLDGRRFSAEVGENGKPKPEQDEILFASGRLRSKACDAYGFGSGAYETATKDGVTTFEAETTSAEEAKIHWKGTLKRDAIEASYVWAKAGQAHIEYWLKGRAAPPAPK